jgi:hypothetical protein
VPPVLRVKLDGLKAIVAQLETAAAPTDAMQDLMRRR